MSLRYTMKNRGINNKSNEEENVILSEEEQKKIIQELKEEANNQSEFFRKLFSYLFLIIAIIFFIVAILSYYKPFTLQHQKHFSDLVPLEFFLIYYIGSGFCFIVAALVAKNPQDSTLQLVCKITAYILGFFMFVTWSKIFYLHGVTNPVLYWIPSADMLALLLAQYVDFDAKGLVSSAEGLEKYKYEHKSV